MVTYQCCCRCGKELPEERMKYILSIRLFADVDDTVSASDDTQKVENIDYLMNCLENLGEKEDVEEDAPQEMVFLLCRECRNSFCRNPLNKQKLDPEDSTNHNGILH